MKSSTPIAIRATILFLTLATPALAATTWYVNGVSGSDSNNCISSQTACKTIGHAISLASSGNSIMVAAATYTENLVIGLNLTITGSAASTTIVDGGGLNTVVTISSTSAHVSLSKVTIRNGNIAGFHAGGGIDNIGTMMVNKSAITGNTTCFGGGIYNGGTLTVNNSTIKGNSVHHLGLCRGFGGGIANRGTLTVNNSTVSGNRGYDAQYGTVGGGIYNGATLTINNSTISGNGVGGGTNGYKSQGGGIFNGGTLTINNGTLSGNGATSGGGIYNPGAATLQNSIVTNSSSGGNCSGSVTSHGYNLSSDGTCNFDGTGDLNNTDPLLGPLQNNGGPTQTMALLSGSPAIDSGNPSGCTDGQGHLLKTDQRGAPRPDTEDTAGCDRGAYERQSD